MLQVKLHVQTRMTTRLERIRIINNYHPTFKITSKQNLRHLVIFLLSRTDGLAKLPLVQAQAIFDVELRFKFSMTLIFGVFNFI